MSDERWLPIIGFDGLYEVSDLGRIRSLSHKTVTRNRWGEIERSFPGRILSTLPSGNGYRQVTLCDGAGNRTQRMVHSVVAEAFIGPRPDDAMVLHRDGVKTNCAFSNLRYGTVLENSADAASHGHQVRGSRQGSARLDEIMVAEIRANAGGLTHEALAARYGVVKGTIGFIMRRETWRHVDARHVRALGLL